MTEGKLIGLAMLGICVYLVIIITKSIYPKYKLRQVKRRRRLLNQKRQGLKVNLKPQWPMVLLYLGFACGIPIGLFFFFRFVYRKVTSEIGALGTDFGTIPKWVLLVGLGLILIIVLSYSIRFFSIKKPSWNRKSLGWIIGVPLLIGLGVFVYNQIKKGGSEKLFSGNASTTSQTQSSTTFPQILPDLETIFAVGDKRSFRIKNFGDPYYPIPVNTTDTITFYCHGPSGSWSYKVWNHDGKTGYEELVGQQSIVAGIHTIWVNKPCTLVLSTKVPPLL